MSAKAKKVTVLLVAVIAIAALGLGAWGVSMYFLPFGHDSAQGYTISFNSNTVLMRSDAVTAPASGYVRRDFSAKVLDGEGYEVEDADISYSISKQVEGVELSETIDGFAPATSPAYEKAGVSISEEGVLTVTDRAWEGNKDVFVTAYYDDEVKQTYHIKLSRDTVRDDRLMFEGRGADVSEEYLGSGYRAVYILKKGESLQLKARLYDQYLNVRDVAPQYFLSQDLTGIEGEYDGVSLSGGMLHLSETSSLRTGDIITVTAKAGSKQAAAFIKVK